MLKKLDPFQTYSYQIVVSSDDTSDDAIQKTWHMFKETMPLDNEKPLSLILCGGDYSYSDSNPHRWDSWFTIMEPLIARTPFQLVAGNHEVKCDAETLRVHHHGTPISHALPQKRSPGTK